MNNTVVFFLTEVEMIDKLIIEGLMLNNVYVSVFPLSGVSKKKQKRVVYSVSFY